MTRPARIAVLGCSGSGKSTLAARLADALGLPLAASDHIYWTDDWRPTPAAEVRAWIDRTTAGAAWVVDGNFDVDRDLLWRRAQLVVWLDFPLRVVLVRVARRNFVWWLKGERVWGGQRMTLGKAWSGIRHSLRSHALKRRAYPGWLGELKGAEVVRLRSPKAAARWTVAFVEVRAGRSEHC